MTPEQATRIQQRLGVTADGAIGPQTFAALFRHMGATDHASILGKDSAALFPEYEITTRFRLAHYLGQFGH